MKKYTFKVEKVGRKWYQIEVSGKVSTYKAQLAIDDDATGGRLTVGQTYTMECRFEDKSTSYGKKYQMYAISKEAIEAARQKEAAEQKAAAAAQAAKQAQYEEEKRQRLIRQWMGYIHESAANDKIYTKGISVIKELGAYDQYRDEIEQLKQDIAERKATKAAEAAAERAKYTWLKISVFYGACGTRVPDCDVSEDNTMVYNGRVYEAIDSKYVKEDDGEYSGCYCDEHFEFKCIDITETEKGKKMLADIEAAKAEKAKITEMKKDIQENGVEAIGDIPEGEIILNTFDNYGNGEMIVKTETEVWYIRNNGADGDDWSRNKIKTGGAGGYGWKILIADKKRKEKIKRINEIIKEMEFITGAFYGCTHTDIDDMTDEQLIRWYENTPSWDPENAAGVTYSQEDAKKMVELEQEVIGLIGECV